MQEKEEKGLVDFSGSKSDDLEEKLQVVCLPKLSRGVIHDVKEVRIASGVPCTHTLSNRTTPWSCVRSAVPANGNG